MCGARGRLSVRGPPVPAVLDWSGRSEFAQPPAPRRVPFYRLTIHERSRQAWLLLYAPSVARVRITQLGVYPYGSIAPYRRSVTPEGVSPLARATHGLTPFPSPSSWR